MRIEKLIALLPLLIGMAACSNDMERVAFFAHQEMPAQQLDTAQVIRTTSGQLQMTMEAPHIKLYKQPEAKTECPRGVTLRFFDANNREKTLIRADYGLSYDDRNWMELKKNVVIIDRRSGDTSYLYDLYWNGAEHTIFSNHTVRQVNGPRVTIGDRFVSDDNFDSPQIVHQRGTLLIEEN